MKMFLVILLLSNVSTLVFSACPAIISKSQWGGRVANYIDYTIRPVKYVIIHHTDTSICTNENDCARRLVNMQTYHMDHLGFDDISYNFIIGGDGQVYEGRGWHKVGAHTKNWNNKSLGIALVGNFNSKYPNAKQLEATKKFIQCCLDLGEIDKHYKLIGARTLRHTDSPGTLLFDIIQNWRGFTQSP